LTISPKNRNSEGDGSLVNLGCFDYPFISQKVMGPYVETKLAHMVKILDELEKCPFEEFSNGNNFKKI